MRLLALLICLLPPLASLHAHSLHQTTAEAEYIPQTQKLEVSLTVFINDFELALIRHTERLISFEKTPAAELDTAIQSYLTQTFLITDSAGKAAKLEWLGREADPATAKTPDPAVTLFFEIPLPNGIQNATLQHSVLCDLFQDQINLIHLRNGTRKVELSFKRGDAAKDPVW